MCWVSYTYYLPDSTVAGHPGAVKQYLSYYQWVPIFFLIQASVVVYFVYKCKSHIVE